MTCVIRPGSTATLPTGVTIKQAEYTELTSLTAALQGQHCIVEAFNPAATSHQSTILAAALAAGVYHIITPDFSGDTFNENAAEILIFDGKRRAQDELERMVVESGDKISWTAIIVGPWYDWTIEKGLFWIDRARRIITRYGSGNQRYSMSRLALSGEALVAVLRDPRKFRNRPVYFASHTVTTNEIIDIIQELGLEGWRVVDAPLASQLKEAQRLWEEDTEKGVQNRLASKAYEIFATVALLDEGNRYGSDFGDKVEPGWDEEVFQLREHLRQLLD